MARLLCFFVLLQGLYGCDGRTGTGRNMDTWVFASYGSTLLEKPDEITLRGIHLGLDKLSHSTVIIHGKVGEVSPHGTYLVLGDESGRLLVMLTELVLEKNYVQGLKGRNLRVLGSVESGKKGLPFLRAQSFWSEEAAAPEVKTDSRA